MNSVLKAYRKKLKFSLRFVAKKTEMSPTTIYYAENGIHELGVKKYERLITFYEESLREKDRL